MGPGAQEGARSPVRSLRRAPRLRARGFLLQRVSGAPSGVPSMESRTVLGIPPSGGGEERSPRLHQACRAWSSAPCSGSLPLVVGRREALSLFLTTHVHFHT